MTRSLGALCACLLALTACEPDPSTPPRPGATPSPSVSPSPLPSPSPARQPGQRRRVALFVPHEDLFWMDFREFMQAATDALGMELEYHAAGNDRERMKEQLRQATSGPAPVDAAVFQSFKQNGEDLLRIADEAGVPAFLVNVGVDEARCGGPRERFRTWLGTMVSDSEKSGYDLACMLADEAQRLGLADDEGRVEMVAIGGIVSDQGSNDRLAGLARAVRERGDILLHQTVPTDWSREDGQAKAAALLERFPTTRVVWGASDPLALGAVASLKAIGRKPGVDAVVGGFDWTAEALDSVLEGELYATLGGEYMAGGWVAVLLHDYFAGRDFASRRLRFQTFMRPITRENVGRFHDAIKQADWRRVDFQALTAPGPDEDYEFDAVKTLEALAAD